MRLAFWRAGGAKELVQKAIVRSKAAAADLAAARERVAIKATSYERPVTRPVAAAATGDLDLHLLGSALIRKRGWIIVPTVLAAVLSITAVNMITPRYKSEARILIDGRENVFLRPNPHFRLPATSRFPTCHCRTLPAAQPRGRSRVSCRCGHRSRE